MRLDVVSSGRIVVSLVFLPSEKRGVGLEVIREEKGRIGVWNRSADIEEDD